VVAPRYDTRTGLEPEMRRASSVILPTSAALTLTERIATIWLAASTTSSESPTSHVDAVLTRRW